MAFKLSNVIGAPFRLYIVQQLATRSVKNSTGKTSLSPLRTADEVLFLANKTAWVKLQSSVNVSGSITDNDTYYDVLKSQDTYDPAWWQEEWGSNKQGKESALAKNWILQSGTSYKAPSTGDLTLRKGIGYNNAYGLGGIKAQGYRPMPGLDSVTIETKGKLGSLRYATVNFKVWNMNQLDVIDALYFRLGFTMLLEWGHTQYYLDNDSKITPNATGIDIPFYDPGVTKESVNQAINKQVFETRGNYDGMLGVVTNFNYSMNQEGGWDCSIKLIGLGSLLDTQRITSNYRLPAGVADYYDRKAAELIEKQRKEDYEKAKDEYNNTVKAANDQYQKDLDAYNKANPIKDIPTLASNKYGTVPKIQITGLYKAARPLPDIGGNPNNIVTNASDLNNFFTLRIAEPLKSINKYSGAYFQDNALYLPYLDEMGFVNPLKEGSTITFQNSILNYVSAKLATEHQTLYNPDSYTINISSGITSILGLLDSLIKLVTTDDDRTLQETTDLYAATEKTSNPFANLVFLNLYKKYISQKGLLGVQDLPVEELTSYSGDERGAFGYKKNVLLVAPAIPKLESKEIRQYLAVAVADILNENGQSILNSGLKFYDTATVDFISQLTKAVADYTGDYTLKVTSLEDQKLSDLTTTYTAAATQTFELTDPSVISFIDKNGYRVNYKKLTVKISVQSSIPTLIRGINNGGIQKPTAVVPTDAPVLQTGEYTAAELSAIKKSSGIESALEAMLRIVQYETLNANWKGKDPKLHKLIKSTGLMLTSTPTTLFSSIFKPTGSGNFTIDEVAISKALVANDIQTNPLSLGLKGFNTSLMSGQSIGSTAITSQGYGDLYKQAYNKCYPADVGTAKAMFEGLCNSFFIPYTVTNTAESSLQVTLSRPVYIKLGYLLFFINNYCLLYDTSKGDNKARPFFYIDFNPETNLCFTMPHQLSVDPFTCLIPFGGNDEDYKEIFTSISGSINQIFNGTVTNTTDRKLFTTEDDILYDVIKGYQTDQPYTAKPMEILLNVEHLLNLLKSSTEADGHGGVYLKPFLDAVATDVNKALGDMNALRVAYYDPSNTVVIVDDQFVTAPSGEENVVQQENSAQKQAITQEWQSYLSRNNTIIMPVYGPGSLVRTFQFETNITTKMSSMIAIGATSGQASAQGIDGTGFRALSKGLVDRVITERTEVAPTTAFIGQVQPQTSITPKDNNQEAAPIKFNQHIKRVYGAGKLDTDDIRAAENYLIINSANVKAGNSYTNANPVIPLNCSFTMDGIGGIMMGNCFLLPDEIMPISVRGNGGLTKFGFIVNKLDHSIQNNEWLTTIGGQMIRLKDVVAPATRPTKKGSSRKPRYGGSSTTPNTGGKRGLSKVKQIVLHHTTGNGNATPADIVKVLNDNKNSAHYIIARDGTVFNMVPLNEIAYHAENFNSTSVGIELINHGAVLSGETIPATEIVDLGFSFNGSQKYQNYTAAQLQSLTKVLKEIMQKCPNIKKNYTNTALSIYQNVFGLKNLTAEPARNSIQTSDKLSTETNNIPGIFIHAAVGTSTHTDTQPTAELFEVLKKI